jgi:hypothetical protein
VFSGGSRGSRSPSDSFDIRLASICLVLLPYVAFFYSIRFWFLHVVFLFLCPFFIRTSPSHDEYKIIDGPGSKWTSFSSESAEEITVGLMKIVQLMLFMM